MPSGGKLKHVEEILEDKFQGQRVADLREADLIWYWYYPFLRKPKNGIILSSDVLKTSQILNGLPGTSVFTTKDYFVTNFHRDYIPEAALTLTDNIQTNVNHYKWIVKNKNHRGIKLYDAQSLQTFSKSQANQLSSTTFIQRLIDNTFLINGHKFDLNLYVTLTNSQINPTPKIEIFDEWLIRFCPEKYNENNLDGYVVSDEYLHPVDLAKQVPTFKFDGSKYNGKEALLGHLYATKNFNLYETLETKLHSIIYDVITSYSYNIEDKTLRFCNSKIFNFFQLVRFDFIIDEHDKVWLMEVNMSPNLDSGHFAANAVLYKKVIDWSLRLGYFDRCLD